MNTNVNLSVVIPYTYSTEQRDKLVEPLIKCINAQTFKDFELIVVEEVSNKLFTHSVFPCRREIDKHILLKNDRTFNKSWCINVGVKQATADNILIVDADSLFGINYFDKVWEFRKHNPRFFSGYNTLICLHGKHNPVIRVLKHSEIKAAGAAWYTDKKFFFNVLGGMCENYFGYGGEDNDIWNRVNYILKGVPELDYPYIHQYHDWAVPPGCGSLEDDESFPNKKQYIKNVETLRYTRNNIVKTIEQLKKIDLGNVNSPREIKI